jgi:hypothetical protein
MEMEARRGAEVFLATAQAVAQEAQSTSPTRGTMRFLQPCGLLFLLPIFAKKNPESPPFGTIVPDTTPSLSIKGRRPTRHA